MTQERQPELEPAQPTAVLGHVLGDVFIPQEPDMANVTINLIYKSLPTGVGGGIGFGVGVVLTSGLNIFRENLSYLFGKGELHPKSPLLLNH